MKYLRMGLIGLLLLVTFSGTTVASAEVIEQVEISISQDENVTNGDMENRVTASIQAVSEKLLIGRKVADVAASHKRFEDIIRQVFDRVLYGYELADVSIIPGKKTVISLKMLPWGDVVQSVAVHIDAGEMAPADKLLLNQDLAGIEPKIAQILIGLPVDAFTWADSVSRGLIREEIAAQLPEFQADIAYVPAQHTVVNIKLQPVGPLIRKTEARLQSETLPKLLLLPVDGSVEAVAEKLNGLPVAFVQRHREEYIERMQREVSMIKYVRKYHLRTGINLDVGEKSEVEVAADTDRYKIKLEGVLDLGRQGDNNTMLRGHAGYLMNPKDEIFLDVEFYPNSISWHFQPGYGRQLSARTYLGMKHDLRDKEDIGLLRYKLNTGLWLNLEQHFNSGYRLTGIRYQLHEYLAAEAMSDQHKTWIRLIAEL
ncbi:MAG TPA: hypothetical protein VN462_07825 [Negativicutes bacterium]|nr:hypothetical protein [Negativicutes bacterium]